MKEELSQRRFQVSRVELTSWLGSAATQTGHRVMPAAGRPTNRGYIDRTGKIIIPLQFEDTCFDFNEGLASVGFNGKRGLIDKTGRFVIEPGFDLSSSAIFDEGIASFTRERPSLADCPFVDCCPAPFAGQ